MLGDGLLAIEIRYFVLLTLSGVLPAAMAGL